MWRNLVTPEKSKVAETLDEFRGNHRYNLLDENVRRFNASLSQFVIWDDHEVLNNWYPTRSSATDMPHTEQQRRAARGAREARVSGIHADAARRRRSRTHLSRVPIRTAGRHLRVRHAQLSRRRTSPNRQTALSDGVRDPRVRRRSHWLKQRLLARRATWKIVASDMPLGLVVA